MRLFELRPPGNVPRLALHPRVTIVRGLDDDAVEKLKQLLHDLADGREPGWKGTVEVHGVLIPLESAARLVGPVVGEPVITRIEEVLPPIPGSRSGGRADSAVSAHEQAVAAREAVEAAVTDLTRRLAGVTHERRGLDEQLAAAADRIDPEAAAALDRADADLQRAARSACIDANRTLPDPGARLAQLRELIADCDRFLLALPVGDRVRLAAATASLRASLSSGPVPSPEACAVAEVWSSLHGRLGVIELRAEISSRDTDVVAARLENARACYADLREKTTPRQVSGDEAAQLEQFHIQMVELESRATNGVRRGSARRQLEEVHAELSKRLEALGHRTWMSYRMSAGITTVNPDDEQKMELARQELEAAETEWADLVSHLDDDGELMDLLAAVEKTGEHVARLLGVEADELRSEPPERVTERLRALLVDAGSRATDRDRAVEQVQTMLDHAGAMGHRDVVAAESVLALGESWLDVLRASDDATVRLLRDRDRAESEIVAIGELSANDGADPLGEARAAVSAAEQSVSELRRGLVGEALTRKSLHELAAAELAALEDHDAKAELLEAARVIEDLAAAKVPPASAPASTWRGISTLVPRGIGGPVPMLVELGEVDDSSLEQLAAVPEDVQVLAIGGGDGVVDWVASHGSSHATILDVSAAV